MRSRTKTQSWLRSEDAVFLLLFGLMRSGQVMLRSLVRWQELKSLKSQAAVWQLDTQLLNSPHSDAKLLFHPLTDTTPDTPNSRQINKGRTDISSELDWIPISVH